MQKIFLPMLIFLMLSMFVTGCEESRGLPHRLAPVPAPVPAPAPVLQSLTEKVVAGTGLPAVASYYILREKSSLKLSDDGSVEHQAYYGGTEIIHIDSDFIVVASCALSGSAMTTGLYRYSLTQTGVVYTASASVAGELVDQHSMDSYNGSLRVVTFDRNGGFLVYILDKDMNLIGFTDSFAKGETVRSAHFSGNTAYVTTNNPNGSLYCIDLADPTKPGILGEMKIPGS